MAGIYTIHAGGTKAIDLPEEAWRSITGGASGDIGELEPLFKAVPWLNRGIGITSSALSNLPWVILNKSGDEIDTSEDYQNAAGVWENPFSDLGLMEASLNLFGSSYWLKEKRGRGRMTLPAGLRYFVPGTITPKLSASEGLTGFERKISGRTPEMFDVDEIIYIWMADPFSELGPPGWSRAMAAMNAADVLANVDEFAAEFFKRGAIKTTLLRVQGNPPAAEKERIKSMWGRIMKGMKTAWSNLVVNADALDPVMIGEGISELGNSELTKEKREDIANALGIPQSVLFSNAANFATAENDYRKFYNETVIPDARLISSAVNTQYLEPLGYRLQFRPAEMDIFQEDEEDRSGVVLNLANAVLSAPPKIASLMFQVAGIELPGGMEYDEFERLLAENEVEAEPDAPAPTLTPAEGSVPEEEDDPEAKSALMDELARWERKALKRVKKGQTAQVKFTSEVIDDLTHAAISGALDAAITEDDVKAAFIFYG